MSEKTVNKIRVGEEEYDIRDSSVGEQVQALEDELEDVKSAISGISSASMLPFMAYAKRNGNISGSGTWNYVNSNYQHVLIPVFAGDVIKISRAESATDGKYGRYAILTSDAAPVNDQAAPLATGYTTEVQFGQTEVSVTVPADGKFLFIITTYNTNAYLPSTLKINNIDYVLPSQQKMIESIKAEIDTRISNDEGKIDNNTNRLDSVQRSGIMPLSAYPETIGNISGSGTWNNLTENYKHVLIPVIGGSVVNMQRNISDGKYARYSVLAGYITPVNGESLQYATGYTGFIQLGTTEITITLPDDAKFLLIMTTYGGNHYLPTKLVIDHFDYLSGTTAEMIAKWYDAVKPTELVPYQYALSNIICIGDSLTAGAYPDAVPGTSWTKGKQVQQNYPYYLGRMLNTPCKNMGYPGYSAAEWWAWCQTWDPTQPNRQAYQFGIYDAAIIWLGTNEGLTDTLATDAPAGTSYENYANTNTGCYCKIIEHIRSIKPDMFIALMTIFNGVGHTPANDNAVIRQIAARYSLPVIDMSDLTNANYPTFHGPDDPTHLRKAGNIFVANRIINMLKSTFNDDTSLCEFGFSAREN